MKFFISILGWFLWNWAELTMTKKELDEDGDPQTNFTIKDFASKKWAMWIGSFASIFMLLWIGSAKLSLHPFEVITGEKMAWNDFYYLLSGAAWDAVLFGVTYIHKFFKKRSETI